jgi:hypothetical protein
VIVKLAAKAVYERQVKLRLNYILFFHQLTITHNSGGSKMKKTTQRVTPIMSFILFFLWIFATPCLADQVTIVGEVNESYQIVAGGQISAVNENELGNDLVTNYISQTVKVTGTIEEKDEVKIITVSTFKVVAK